MNQIKKNIVEISAFNFFLMCREQHNFYFIQIHFTPSLYKIRFDFFCVFPNST